MPELRLVRHGADVQSVFDLLGTLETDMTAALGYAVARCWPIAAGIIAATTGGRVVPTADTVVTLENPLAGEGRTDIEIGVPGRALIVVEAKRRAQLPPREQLALYVPRLRRAQQEGLMPALLLITSASAAVARSQLRNLGSPGIVLAHLSWRQVLVISKEAATATRGRQQSIAREYVRYLNRGEEMDERRSNMTYVVALADGCPSGWALSWRDVVRERSRYFYPVGKGWPDPPNYMAFRYDGRLQSIHHVESHAEFTRPREIFSEATDEEWPPHYCLTLGPAIRPPHIVRAGPSVRYAARVWCMLDTLLTSASITDALRETKRRLADSDDLSPVIGT